MCPTRDRRSPAGCVPALICRPILTCSACSPRRRYLQLPTDLASEPIVDSPNGAAPLSARPGDQSSGCGCRPRQPPGNPACEGGAQARGASCNDRQVQRLAFAPIVGVSRLRGEHESQRVDDVGPCLVPRSALAEDAGDLGNRRDDPAFLAGFVDNRQISCSGAGQTITPEMASGPPDAPPEPILPTPAFAGDSQARPARFELATSRSGGERSIH